MATGITNTIRTALHDTVKANLPALVSALGLPAVKTWERYARNRSDATSAPCVMFSCNGFEQPDDTFSAGDTAQGIRTYSFAVYVLCVGSDEAEAEERIAGYVDCLTAVLDDPTNRTLGHAKVFDVWPGRAQIGETGTLTSGCFKAAEVTVKVAWWQSVGDSTG